MTTNPLQAMRRRSSVRRALTGVIALGLVALPACGSDDDDGVDTPTESVFDTTAPIDNSVVGNTPAVPGDTTTVGSMAPGETTAP